MSTRRDRIAALVAAIASGSAALLSTVAVVPASAAADNVAQHAGVRSGTADTWSFVRRACRTFASGTACTNLETLGGTSYRVVYQLQPSAGAWMRPAATAAWHTQGNPHNHDAIGAAATYKAFCSSTCPQVENATNYVVTVAGPAVYTFLFDSSSGRADVSAGVAGPSLQNSYNACFGGSVSAQIGLTTTSDGTVYYYRRGYGAGGVQSMVLFDSGKRVFTHVLAHAASDYVTPQLYTGWQRTRDSSGVWYTQSTVAWMKYVNGERYSSEGIESPVC